MSDRVTTSYDEGMGLGEVEEAETPETEILDADESDAGDGSETDGLDEGQEEEAGDVTPPRGGGGAATPRSLRARAQQAERELAEERRLRAEAEGRWQGLQSARTQDPQAAERARAQERALLEQMSPLEQLEYVRQQERQAVGNAFQAMRLEMFDATDQQRYDAMAARSPMRDRYRTRVEDAYRQERAAGNIRISREAVFHYLLGKDAEERAMRAAPGQRRAAAQRVAGQQTRPTGARGDAGGSGPRRGSNDSIEAARERLKGQPLW